MFVLLKATTWLFCEEIRSNPTFPNKMISENTKMIDSPEAKKKVKYQMLCHPDIVDLVSESSNDEHDVDSISRCKNLDEKSPPSPPSSNTSYEFTNEIKSPVTNSSKESEIVDNSTINSSWINMQIGLDEMLATCVNVIDGDISFDELIREFEIEKENGSTLQLHSNFPNHKRQMYTPETHDNKLCAIKSNLAFYNKNKRMRTIGDIPRQKPRSRHEITIGVPNIFKDQSSEVEQSKKTLKKFVQKGICLSLPSTIEKCIECRVYQVKKNLTKCDYDNISCRFYAFRLLKFNKSGKLTVAGYPDPYKNLTIIDMGMWLPGEHSSPPSKFNIQASLKILEDAGGQFCKFVQDENEALKLNCSNERKRCKVLWKKCVNGVREMCDVCKTTIFNHHWSCRKCGFVVCVDCFRTKFKRTQSTQTQNNKQKNKKWLPCSDEEEHQVDQLSITQILAGDALNFISKLMHRICITNNIPIDCNCNEKIKICKPHISTSVDIFPCSVYESNISEVVEEESSKLKTIINKVALNNKHLFCESETNQSQHKDYLAVSSSNNQSSMDENFMKTKETFAPKLTLMFDNKTNSSYTWLCEGHLLRLLNPKSNDNYAIFQEQWKRGQPVLVSNVGKNLNSKLWHPKSFSRDFGNQKNDIIDCTTGKVFTDHPMSKFWNGFENVDERLCDKQGCPMLLKLKDWPASADFAETLPDRFQDLMDCLPLKEYTHRNGRFNLASRLPECFVPPDLGPKMYTAYGNAGIMYNKIGTTNLHLDMSDAVNVMVYVAITKNSKEHNSDWYVRKALEVIEEAGCDDLTKRRISIHGETPGALWHIYHASDAAAIRDLLIQVAVEHATPLEEFSDPIHDQSHYLDEYLRERLFREYGVKGYSIVQFYGDAVFIPAGAPHQVRNLHNCIKVAEDFVSPENIHHSFRMTQEFRNLTDSHTNHEDKLQIKNIVFHAIKDSISVLMHNRSKL